MLFEKYAFSSSVFSMVIVFAKLNPFMRNIEKWPAYYKNLLVFAKILKHVEPFFNITNERVNRFVKFWIKFSKPSYFFNFFWVFTFTVYLHCLGIHKIVRDSFHHYLLLSPLLLHLKFIVVIAWWCCYIHSTFCQLALISEFIWNKVFKKNK